MGPYLRRASKAGIDKTVVFPTLNDDYPAACSRLAAIVSRMPGRLIGFAMVHTVRDRGKLQDQLRRCVEEYGFRGVKVHGHQGMPTRELCEAARQFRIPVLVDVADKPWRVELFAKEYSDVPFVIAHLGSFRDDWRVQQAVIDLMLRFPNVSADTSGVRRFDLLCQAVKRLGPARILFGSDGPYLHPGLELHKIQLMGLPPAAEGLITGGNAARLLRLGQSSSRVVRGVAATR
jgi:predicted TIM-barrel fold metal-dependent hydrolase